MGIKGSTTVNFHGKDHTGTVPAAHFWYNIRDVREVESRRVRLVLH